MKKQTKRILNILSAIALLAGISIQALPPGVAEAAQITDRSLTLEADQDAAWCSGLTTGANNTLTNAVCDANGDGLPDGGSTPSAPPIPAYVSHLFTFTAPGTADSITITYCTTAATVVGGIDCNPPTDLNANNATLGADGGTGFTISGKTANSITLTGPAKTLSLVSGLRLDDIANPSAANTTFFARISTTNAGNPVDSGTVAASTTNLIQLTGTMPESLVFCTGATVNINVSGVPDCTTATSGAISFNQLFDPNTTSWATSQMAASTNGTKGYAITVNGPTLTSGSNTITAMSPADISRPGTKQFGMNLIDDFTGKGTIVTDPTIGNGSPDPITYYNGDSAGTGAAIHPVSDGADFNAIQEAGFDGAGGAGNVPTYKFTAGTNNLVAASDYGAAGPTGTAIASNTQRYTATYIANVSGNLPAGSYKTTLTYVCTPTF